MDKSILVETTTVTPQSTRDSRCSTPLGLAVLISKKPWGFSRGYLRSLGFGTSVRQLGRYLRPSIDRCTQTKFQPNTVILVTFNFANSTVRSCHTGSTRQYCIRTGKSKTSRKNRNASKSSGISSAKMKKLISRLLLTAALAGSQVVSAQDVTPPAPNTTPSPAVVRSNGEVSNLKELYKRALPSVCWIRGQARKDGGYLMGTGWVVDAQRKLIITNEHVVANSESVLVSFPEHENGHLVVEPKAYTNGSQSIGGTVLMVDSKRDLALIQLEKLPTTATSLTMVTEEPENGDELFTIAGLPEGSEGLWIMTVGHVRLSYRRSHANAAVCRVVETDLATNKGNSGGAVFNMRGEVVSVFEGFSTNARLVTMTISASEVRDFISENETLITPATAEAFTARGQKHHDTNRLTLANADYAQALRMDPKYAPAHTGQGWLFFIRKDFQTAKSIFESSLELDSENASAYNGLGCSLCEMQQYPESIEAFTNAIRRTPTDAAIYRNRGVSHGWMKSYDSAVADLGQAINLNDKVDEYYQLRANHLRDLKRYQEACDDLAKALKLAPEKSDLWSSFGYALQESNQLNDAVIALGRSLELNKNQPEVHNARGNCLYSMSKYQDAANEFLTAIQLNPRDFQYHNSLGNSFYSMNLYAQAIKCYDAAIQLQPNDAQLYRNRAAAYEQSGNANAALADNEQAKAVEAKKS